MLTSLLKKILKGSTEVLNVDCVSCSNCNGRSCGRIKVKMMLTHDEYRELFGSKTHGDLLRVGNLPMTRKEAIKKILKENDNANG